MYSDPIKKLIFAYDRQPQEMRVGSGEPKIKVNVSISRVAFLYEKIRNAIDYKDEHLLRKNAIARMLKRRFYTEERTKDFGRLLLTELIRARYLPNNTLRESLTADVDAIIYKYLVLLKVVASDRMSKQKRQSAEWILSICATEIEHTLVPQTREDAIVECMYKVIRQDVDLAQQIIDPTERDVQVYIAIHRSLIKSDFAIIRYHLLYHFVPEWRNPTPEVLEQVISHFYTIMSLVEAQVNHPLANALSRFIKRFSILFSILRDVIDKDPQGFDALITDPDAYAEKIREVCNERYAKARSKLRRSYIRTIIYIFFTKMLLALVLELPYDLFIIKSTSYQPLFINVLFHPILMFIIAASITLPGKNNTEKIIELLKKITYENPRPGFLYKKRKAFSRSRALEIIFKIVYAVTFLLTFGVIVAILRKLEFNIVSGFLFIFFISVISFFGMKLRREVKDLVIVDQKDSFVSMVIDFFSIPVLRVGQYVSEKTPKINLFLFVLDFIIEAPLKIFVEVAEDWTSYQREKKEQII